MGMRKLVLSLPSLLLFAFLLFPGVTLGQEEEPELNTSEEEAPPARRTSDRPEGRGSV